MIGCNIAVLRQRYDIMVLDVNVRHVVKQCLFNRPEVTGTAMCILELLRVSNNEIVLPGFTISDVHSMMHSLCTVNFRSHILSVFLVFFFFSYCFTGRIKKSSEKCDRCRL